MTLVMTGRIEAQSHALGFSALHEAASALSTLAKLSANCVSLVLPAHPGGRLPPHAEALLVFCRHRRHGRPVAPAILELLVDGVPRSKRAIAAKLADRHPKDEVVRTLMRLAVTDRVAETGGKYVVAR